MASSTLQFALTDTAVLSLQKGDLTKFKGDAIVNAGTPQLGFASIDHRTSHLIYFDINKRVLFNV